MRFATDSGPVLSFVLIWGLNQVDAALDANNVRTLSKYVEQAKRHFELLDTDVLKGKTVN